MLIGPSVVLLLAALCQLGPARRTQRSGEAVDHATFVESLSDPRVELGTQWWEGFPRLDLERDAPDLAPLLESVGQASSVCPRHIAESLGGSRELMVVSVGVGEDGGGDVLVSSCSKSDPTDCKEMQGVTDWLRREVDAKRHRLSLGPTPKLDNGTSALHRGVAAGFARNPALAVGAASLLAVPSAGRGRQQARNSARRPGPPQMRNSGSSVGEDSCAICLQDMDHQPRRLRCGHRFCRQCIRNWLRKSNACPTCRQSVHVTGRNSTGERAAARRAAERAAEQRQDEQERLEEQAILRHQLNLVLREAREEEESARDVMQQLQEVAMDRITPISIAGITNVGMGLAILLTYGVDGPVALIAFNCVLSGLSVCTMATLYTCLLRPREP
mmetsp:Transcript_53110/g.153216  ORF Transcript_53110/g.153216 Transcript_53110/m.153216 type:complete len:387 (-) Transcript_53110:293-1453(-)